MHHTLLHNHSRICCSYDHSMLHTCILHILATPSSFSPCILCCCSTPPHLFQATAGNVRLTAHCCSIPLCMGGGGRRYKCTHPVRCELTHTPCLSSSLLPAPPLPPTTITPKDTVRALHAVNCHFTPSSRHLSATNHNSIHRSLQRPFAPLPPPPNPLPAALTLPLTPLPHVQPRSAPLHNPPCQACTAQQASTNTTTTHRTNRLPPLHGKRANSSTAITKKTTAPSRPTPHLFFSSSNPIRRGGENEAAAASNRLTARLRVQVGCGSDV